MSPAAARGDPDTLHSWVGIIMYLPTSDPAQRQAITDKCAPLCLLHANACQFASARVAQEEYRSGCG